MLITVCCIFFCLLFIVNTTIKCWKPVVTIFNNSTTTLRYVFCYTAIQPR